MEPVAAIGTALTRTDIALRLAPDHSFVLLGGRRVASVKRIGGVRGLGQSGRDSLFLLEGLFVDDRAAADVQRLRGLVGFVVPVRDWNAPIQVMLVEMPSVSLKALRSRLGRLVLEPPRIELDVFSDSVR
jgi:hypothetical protein